MVLLGQHLQRLRDHDARLPLEELIHLRLQHDDHVVGHAAFVLVRDHFLHDVKEEVAVDLSVAVQTFVQVVVVEGVARVQRVHGHEGAHLQNHDAQVEHLGLGLVDQDFLLEHRGLIVELFGRNVAARLRLVGGLFVLQLGLVADAFFQGLFFLDLGKNALFQRFDGFLHFVAPRRRVV